MDPKPWFKMILKLIIVGDPSVGKTSLLRRIVENKFSQTYRSTLGVDFMFKEMDIGDSKVKLQIWDTAGQEKFRSMITTYYKHTNGIIIVFDLSNLSSFQNILEKWLAHIKAYTPSDSPKVLLLGNKLDLMAGQRDLIEPAQVKKRLESNSFMILRDLSINAPRAHNQAISDLDYKVNGGRAGAARVRSATSARPSRCRESELTTSGERIRQQVRSELSRASEDTMVFDYMYREVSAQSGKGVFEAVRDFGRVLFEFQSRRKIKAKVRV